MTDASAKNKILFVPGKNPKPRPEAHKALLWRCLTRGVELVNPDVAQELRASPDSFDIVPWNAIYYGHIKEVEEDVPWIELLCQKTGPEARDIRHALSWWRHKPARLLYTLADLFPFLISLLPDPAVKSTVRETERYFRNHDNIGSHVRELVKAPLRRMLLQGERALVIGHSLGSVIAYDALWELTHLEKCAGRVDLFLTLGSPLGMRFVQDRILGFHQPDHRFPGNIRRWVNVAAHGDLTALDPEIRDDFLPMLEQGCTESIEDWHRGVFNYFRNEEGLNEHRSYGYLVEQHVARAVSDWWQGDGTGSVLSGALASGRGIA